ncbi:MAG: CinA family nicotinamide mononucleotide deamidase-related protein [Desulfobulbaceae bacterium]|nr:MAG: CinA family nicotinamide mononucleotide deamidase-related protein [Desulfobulbaceae bacterium]
MLGEIIAIGDELTSGRILNTTSGYAARKLYDAGYTIHAMSTIGDTPKLIGEALLRAITRVDFVIVTGGLGSTDDDLTNEAVSKALNRPTMPNLEILSRIRAHLFSQADAVDSPLEKLAWLPKGADPFNPESKIAGYQLIHDQTLIFFMPGIPSEMKELMSNTVLPRLAAWKAGSRLKTHRRIYKIFNMAESGLNQMINSLNLPEDISIGYYPDFPDVHLSILQRGKAREVSPERFEDACRKVEHLLGSAIYGTDHDDLALVVGKLLEDQSLQLGVAESCTGGLISQRITSIPGSSNYFLGGAVTYSNELKEKILGVSHADLERFGAVSAEVAEAMAHGVLQNTGADVSLSSTGIAGPGGGSPDKPVGTVYLALADKENCQVISCKFSGDRNRIQLITAHTALNMLRLYLIDKS